MQKISLILDNIRSVHNVGSIFRTADAVGVLKIYCVGTTPTPLDRFARERSDFSKVSLGAEKTVSWDYFQTAGECLEKIKGEGVKIIALEQDSRAKNLKDFSPGGDVVLIVGNEVSGVSKEFLEAADEILEIPIQGKKESLNVSVSAGIAIYKIAGLL
jgi:23S rRNA (guanosine2251-2'-O)-methyltransferase